MILQARELKLLQGLNAGRYPAAYRSNRLLDGLIAMGLVAVETGYAVVTPKGREVLNAAP